MEGFVFYIGLLQSRRTCLMWCACAMAMLRCRANSYVRQQAPGYIHDCQSAPMFWFSFSGTSDFNRFLTVNLPQLPKNAVQRRFWPGKCEKRSDIEFFDAFLATKTQNKIDLVFQTCRFRTDKPSNKKHWSAPCSCLSLKKAPPCNPN